MAWSLVCDWCLRANVWRGITTPRRGANATKKRRSEGILLKTVCPQARYARSRCGADRGHLLRTAYLRAHQTPRPAAVSVVSVRCYGCGLAARQPRPHFIGISKSHTTNFAVVAPGIAEALLATERLGDRTLVGGLGRLEPTRLRSEARRPPPSPRSACCPRARDADMSAAIGPGEYREAFHRWNGFCPRMERFLSTDGTQGPFIYVFLSMFFSISLIIKRRSNRSFQSSCPILLDGDQA